MKTDTEGKRQHILEIAASLFSKFGFAKTTLDDIADAVGMKKGSLYYYFNSKEAIFSAVIHEVATKVFSRMKEAAATAMTARDAILKSVESGLRTSKDTTNVIGVSVQVKMELMPLADRILKGFHEDLIKYLSDIIDQGIRNGEFRPCDSTRVAHAVNSSIEGIERGASYRDSILGIQKFDIEKVIDESLFLVNLILDGLRPGATSPTMPSRN
ncbi:TetR/AcrR family transcriptional regulator [bacterium]|nr:TetR/AcrR family transcriptional regulator [bacterium]